ncbi:MAG: phosphoribosylformylglycinamidine synthase subunit PurS [Acidimicrobiales bacterium]
MMSARQFPVLVEVGLRPGIADPQGATIERALPALGFDGVHTVRAGKAFRLTVDATDRNDAQARATDIADRLLANPVIEIYEVTVFEAESPNAASSS